MAKKRLPIEQLKAAGKAAKEMLVKRGIEAEHSIIDDIVGTENAPKLPGIPPYLPHRWTLSAAQRILYDLLIMWKAESKEEDRDNITLFFQFVVAKLREQEVEYNKELVQMPKTFKEMEEGNIPVIKDIFMPMRKKENLKAIQRFLIDSFAVAIILKRHESVADYSNWFLDWTQDLFLLWIAPDKRAEEKRV